METRNTLYCDQCNYSWAGPIVSCHTCWRNPHVNTPGPPIPWPFLRLIPPSVVKSNALGHLPQRLVHSLHVWLARGGTGVQPHRTFWGRSLAHCLYSQTVHPWLKRPTATPWTLTLWPTLHPRCIARFSSVSMSFGLACRLGTCWSWKSDGCSISHPRRH